MCWTGKITGFRIAFKDVPVIKVCYKRGDFKGYLSKIQNYLYDLNKTEKAKLGITPSKVRKGFFFDINEGLHSYEATKFWSEWANYYNVSEYIGLISDENCNYHYVVGFIPKGSIYFINDSGEIVSNKLKLVYDLATKVKKSGD